MRSIAAALALGLATCASPPPPAPTPAAPVPAPGATASSSPHDFTLPDYAGGPAPVPSLAPSDTALPTYQSMPDGPPLPPPPAPAPASKPAPMPKYVSPNKAEAAACRARGGELRPVCMAGDEMCVLRFRDAGKSCTDKKDCTGKCLYVGENPHVGATGVTGRCEPDNDPCGCMAVIKGGRIVSNDCRD